MLASEIPSACQVRLHALSPPLSPIRAWLLFLWRPLLREIQRRRNIGKVQGKRVEKGASLPAGTNFHTLSHHDQRK